MGGAAAKKAPVQVSWGILTLMFGKWMLAAYACWKVYKWLRGRVKVLLHHPIIITALLLGWLLRGWWPYAHLGIMALVYVVLFILMTRYPHIYRRHLDGRIRGAVHSRRYRKELRPNLKAVGVVNDKDRFTPLVMSIHETPHLARVRIYMVAGQKVEDYLKLADRLAPTFHAQDCKVEAVRVDRPAGLQKRWPFIQLERRPLPRQLYLDFLTANPLSKTLSTQYIDFYLNPDDPLPVEGNPAAMRRDGTPCRLPRGRHLLLVGLTGAGKSNALRAHMYADRLAIQAGLLEVWGLDGKGGIEVGYMQHLFARYCYGDGPNDEHFYAETFAAITADAVRIMLRRLKGLRGDDVLHVPVPGDPALRLVVDEMLIFAAEFIPNPVAKEIFSNIALIQRLGRAANVTVLGCAQDPRKADLPNRGGFTDFRTFKVNDPLDVDLAMGRGTYQRGAKSDQIPFDQQGTAYEDTDSGGTPGEIRYPMVTNAEIKRLPAAPPSAFPQFAEPMWTQPPPRAAKPAGMSEGAVIIEHDGEPEEVDRELVAIGAGPPRPRVRRMRDRARSRKAG